MSKCVFYLFLLHSKWTHLKMILGQWLLGLQSLDNWPKLYLFVSIKTIQKHAKSFFYICDASQLLENCYSEFPHPVQLERFMKFNKDFNDYIDCDITTTVQEYDKFQVHVATVVTLQVIPIQPPQMENIQVSTAVKLSLNHLFLLNQKLLTTFDLLIWLDGKLSTITVLTDQEGVWYYGWMSSHRHAIYNGKKKDHHYQRQWSCCKKWIVSLCFMDRF